MSKPRQRIPKLRFTTWRKLGWHVAYRDRRTGIPRKHLFNVRKRDREPEARVLYHAWVDDYLGANGKSEPSQEATSTPRPPSKTTVPSGSPLETASGLIESERIRVRTDDGPRRRGTIHPRVFMDRKKQVYDVLEFLNSLHGIGAVSRLRLSDLSLEDIEAYNQHIAAKGHSASQVSKRVQIVKSIIDRAGRPEHGRQLLGCLGSCKGVPIGDAAPER